MTKVISTNVNTAQEYQNALEKLYLFGDLTTTQLINSTVIYTIETVINTSGFTTIGDGGEKGWKQSGTTGVTASQSPAQLTNATLLNDGNGNQWAMVLTGSTKLEASGGVSGGVTPNHLVFQSFLNAGIIGVLGNNKSYATGSRSMWAANNSGFISEGKSKIVMLEAGFDASTYGGYLANSIGFYAQAFDNVVFKGIHIEFESHTAVRTASGLSVRACTNLDIDVETSGFSSMQYGSVAMDSCIGGVISVYAHDITSNATTLPSIQLTGFMVDEDRVDSIYSKDVHIKNPRFKNITLGAAALTAYGHQTDGLTLAGGLSSGGGGCVVDVVIVDNVAEGVDIQSANHVIAGIKARDIHGSALKLIHAGKNNTIGDITAVNVGDSVVVFGGTNNSSESADNNTIGNIVATGVGNLTGTGQSKCAIHFSGSDATYKPNNNKVKSITVTDSPNMVNVVLDEAGLKNKVLDVSGSGSAGVCTIDTGQVGLEHVDIRKSPKSLVLGYPSADQTLANDANVVFNTVTQDFYSELNLSTGIFTSVSPIKGRVSVTLRTASLATGKYIGAEIVAGGVVIASARTWNDSASFREGQVTLSSGFMLNNRDVQIRVLLKTNSTSLVITGNSALTTINIEEQ
jgi:hypothetical protein